LGKEFVQLELGHPIHSLNGGQTEPLELFVSQLMVEHCLLPLRPEFSITRLDVLTLNPARHQALTFKIARSFRAPTIRCDDGVAGVELPRAFLGIAGNFNALSPRGPWRVPHPAGSDLCRCLAWRI
jgi:hypothetical protein